MNEVVKEITKEFFLKQYPCKENWFDLAWDVVNDNLNSLSTTIEDRTMGFQHGLAFSGETDSEMVGDMLKLMLVFVDGSQRVIERVGENKIVAIFKEACKKYKLNMNLVKKILSYIETKKIKLENEKLSKERKIGLGLDEFEKYCVKIDDIPRKFQEGEFAELVYIGAANEKNKEVDVEKDLGWGKGRQRYTTLCRSIMPYMPEEKERKDIIPIIKGKIKLIGFEVYIEESISNFESRHYRQVKEFINKIYDDCTIQKTIMSKDNFNIFCQKTARKMENIEKQNMAPMIRQTILVWKATKIMGYRFRDNKWKRGWNSLIKKGNYIYDVLGYDDKEKKELFLHWKT